MYRYSGALVMKNQYGLTGKGIGIAMLDTGIFPHVDFDSRIICFRDFLYGKKSPYDDNGHGTHTAGIAAGSGAASGGLYQGMAPGSHLVILKVLDRKGNGQKQDILRAMDWILMNRKQYRIRIVNISVGTTEKEPALHEALIDGVECLWDAGLHVVTAAGNLGPAPGSVTAPGSSRKVITVGSSDMLVANQGISGRGPTRDCICKPDLVAPGMNIISCAPGRGGGKYIPKSGTSMSTPLISGAIALALEKDPLLTNTEIKILLKESAEDLGYSRNVQGDGEFRLSKFLQKVAD